MIARLWRGAAGNRADAEAYVRHVRANVAPALKAIPGYRELRLLRREKGFAAVALLTLALGIGASTALFSVIDAALLRPLPYPHPEQLVSLLVDVPVADGDRMRVSPSPEDIRTWLAGSRVFTDLAISRDELFPPIVDGPQAERLPTRPVVPTRPTL